MTASVVELVPLIGSGHRSEAPRAREESRSSEGREIRIPNLLIWSQMRCRCAIPPWARRKLTASVVELVPLIGGGHRSEAPRAREESRSSEGREIRTCYLLLLCQTRCRCAIPPLGLEEADRISCRARSPDKAATQRWQAGLGQLRCGEGTWATQKRGAGLADLLNFKKRKRNFFEIYSKSASLPFSSVVGLVAVSPGAQGSKSSGGSGTCGLVELQKERRRLLL